MTAAAGIIRPGTVGGPSGPRPQDNLVDRRRSARGAVSEVLL
jgi:hypothetical protein